MNKLLIFIISIMLFSGCDIANTPTSKVEDYLGRYQRLDNSVSISYTQLAGSNDVDKNNRDRYQKLVEKQFRNLSYEVKEEVIDGDVAYVTVQVKVCNYGDALDKHDVGYYDDNDEYHEKVVEELERQKEKIVYTITFELELNQKDEWEVREPSLEDKDKLLGIY